MHKSLVTRQPIDREVSLIYRGDTIRFQARGKIHKTGDGDKSLFSRRTKPCRNLPKREENAACHRQEHIGKILEQARLCRLKKCTTKLARRNDSGHWTTPQDIKAHYRSASICANNRVVFNIAGNKYRLVVEIQYRAGIAWVKFIGTHAQYDQINVETVSEY